jgi:23S rRNA pseudouridine2605 synthase
MNDRGKTGRRKAAPADTPAMERLQKVLAAAGLGSRRHCETLMLAGRVEVDGQTVTTLGTRVHSGQRILVDGVPLSPGTRARKRYFAVNKPPGVLTTARDPWGRIRVLDLVDSESRLFTVGRLDKSSSGLILVTNDGELANRLAHPRYGVQKTYDVMVAGGVTPEELGQLRRGVHLAEGHVRPVSVKTRRRQKRATVLQIVLAEGRNREIRRMLARVGHKVLQLKRVALGPLRLGNLPLGSHRPLTRDEVRSLRALTARRAAAGSAGLQADDSQPSAVPATVRGGAEATRRGRKARGTAAAVPLPATPASKKKGQAGSKRRRGHLPGGGSAVPAAAGRGRPANRARPRRAKGKH